MLMKFAWKNVLFSTHTKPAYMPPPMYGENMVVCGPLYPNRKSADGTVISLNTPVGQRYDIASVIAALPDEQKPDIVIARIDAGMGNVPVNIAAAGVPTLALLGDSHHMRAPLTNLLRYTLNERYDFHILDHNKQHAHWYLEAGLRNVVWIPALLLDANFKPPVADTKKDIVFIVVDDLRFRGAGRHFDRIVHNPANPHRGHHLHKCHLTQFQAKHLPL